MLLAGFGCARVGFGRLERARRRERAEQPIPGRQVKGRFRGKISPRFGRHFCEHVRQLGGVPKPLCDQLGADEPSDGRLDMNPRECLLGRIASEPRQGAHQRLHAAGPLQVLKAAQRGKHALDRAPPGPVVFNQLKISVLFYSFDPEEHGTSSCLFGTADFGRPVPAAWLMLHCSSENSKILQ
ncbi:MAG TPA: hypothetical protein VKD72_19675 [Gemmataceae bacterium]|nr:hypothetical protein [Gemmataceae bacterium]